MRLNYSTLFILIILFILSNCSLKLGLTDCYLGITKENNPNLQKKIGSYVTIGLKTNDTSPDFFNTSDTDEGIFFRGQFIGINSYTINYFTCHLWNPKNSNLVVLCTKDEDFNLTDSFYEFKVTPFSYKNYHIIISSEANLYFEFQKLDENIPFLYSEPQYIDLSTQKDYYELSFKMESTYPEYFSLTEKEETTSFIHMNNCTIKDYKLFCQVKKEILEEVFTYNTSLNLVYLSKQYGAIKYEFVLDINVIYDRPKKDINILLTEVLTLESEINSTVAIRTNITEIDPLTTKLFLFKFYDNTQYQYKNCFFKKFNNNGNNLLLFLFNGFKR